MVFSQQILAVKHISKVLDGAGIRHVKICQGEQHDAISQAVEDFNTVDDCSVFLLHAGTAAAQVDFAEPAEGHAKAPKSPSLGDASTRCPLSG